MTDYQQKKKRSKYREIAKFVFAEYDHEHGEVKISKNATVKLVKDGAYVKATVFIPKKWYTDSLE